MKVARLFLAVLFMLAALPAVSGAYTSSNSMQSSQGQVDKDLGDRDRGFSTEPQDRYDWSQHDFDSRIGKNTPWNPDRQSR